MAENKKVFSVELLCKQLLQDDALAEKAISKITASVQGKSDKEAAVAATQQCRRLLLRGDSAAFEDIKSSRMLSEQLAFSDIRDDDEDGCYAYLVSQLSHRHRFEYVLKAYAGLSNEEIAKCMKLKAAVVESDLKAAWNTMTRTLDSMQKDREEAVPMYAAVRERIAGYLSDIELPERERIHTYINTGSGKPQREKVKKPPITAPVTASKHKKLGIGAACAAFVCVAAIVLYSIFGVPYAGGYYADIEIEDYGTITVQLNEKEAPITVQNFIDLCDRNFYDGLTFHRIIEGFMMQGGSPNGDGTGGSGSYITGEFAENGYENNLSHTRGAISMARNASNNDSASCQFFIVQEDSSSFLDGSYAAFGYVVSGMEIVDKICADAEPTDDNGTIPADEQPVIKGITIRKA